MYNVCTCICMYGKHCLWLLLFLTFSDSSDSDDDAKEEFSPRAFGPPPTSPPPLVPPHQVPISTLHALRQHQPHNLHLYPVHEEIVIDAGKQSEYVQAMKEKRSRSHSPSFSPTPPSPHTQPVKRQAPPKPPRGSTLIEDDVFQQEDAQVIRQVDSIVDMDARDLYHSYNKMNRVGRERDGLDERGGGGRGEGREVGGDEGSLSQRQRQQLQRRLSFSSDDVRERRHVTSLIEQFERGKTAALMAGFPPSTTHSKHRLPDCPVRGNSAPSVPPRPTQPPRPPRFTGGGSGDPPVIPPHTPAPLIPPRPTSSKVKGH